MTVYLINIALILFWRLCCSRSRAANSRKYYCAIVAIQWILISGLRDWSIGEDTYNYYAIFERAKSTSWTSVFIGFFNYSLQDVLGRDPGYLILTKTFQLFSGSYQLFLLAVAVFFMSTMAIWIYKNSASPCTSYVLFSTLFYSFYALTGHRQAIATALVVFLGYDLIKQRKFWKFAGITFFAFFLHKSSLVFLPVYFLPAVPITMGYMLLCAIATVWIAFLGKSLYAPLAQWFGYSEGQINYAEGGAELYAILLILLCITVWFLYPRIRRHRSDAPILFHINILTLMSAVLTIQNQSFMRIQQYFSLFIMITIPEMINTLKREYRLLGYLVFGAVMIFYLIQNNPQYQFFFMN